MKEIRFLKTIHKSLVSFPVLFCFLSSAVADDLYPLNKISYQISEEQWVTTGTVKVVVSIDATLDKANVETISSQMMENLKKISDKGSWNFTQFERTQDNSGLEQLHLEAEIRLPESELASLRDKAKKLTRPGETYNIQSFEFTPTIAELEQAHTLLRGRIYERARQEMDKLNQLYPGQKYFVHTIDFAPVSILPSAYPAAATSEFATNVGVSARKRVSVPSMQKSTKIVETGNVVIASEVLADKK